MQITCHVRVDNNRGVSVRFEVARTRRSRQVVVFGRGHGRRRFELDHHVAGGLGVGGTFLGARVVEREGTEQCERGDDLGGGGINEPEVTGRVGSRAQFQDRSGGRDAEPDVVGIGRVPLADGRAPAHHARVVLDRAFRVNLGLAENVVDLGRLDARQVTAVHHERVAAVQYGPVDAVPLAHVHSRHVVRVRECRADHVLAERLVEQHHHRARRGHGRRRGHAAYALVVAVDGAALDRGRAHRDPDHRAGVQRPAADAQQRSALQRPAHRAHGAHLRVYEPEPERGHHDVVGSVANDHRAVGRPWLGGQRHGARQRALVHGAGRGARATRHRHRHGPPVGQDRVAADGDAHRRAAVPPGRRRVHGLDRQLRALEPRVHVPAHRRHRVVVCRAPLVEHERARARVVGRAPCVEVRVARPVPRARHAVRAVGARAVLVQQHVAVGHAVHAQHRAVESHVVEQHPRFRRRPVARRPLVHGAAHDSVVDHRAVQRHPVQPAYRPTPVEEHQETVQVVVHPHLERVRLGHRRRVPPRHVRDHHVLRTILLDVHDQVAGYVGRLHARLRFQRPAARGLLRAFTAPREPRAVLRHGVRRTLRTASGRRSEHQCYGEYYSIGIEKTAAIPYILCLKFAAAHDV
uniref:Uncharacterized protein n=1 Tax=Sipha flava TaxID=143950 RepID=A0A2S2R415_9HEMI